jgi:hypothetical protein
VAPFQDIDDAGGKKRENRKRPSQGTKQSRTDLAPARRLASEHSEVKPIMKADIVFPWIISRCHVQGSPHRDNHTKDILFSEISTSLLE